MNYREKLQERVQHQRFAAASLATALRQLNGYIGRCLTNVRWLDAWTLDGDLKRTAKAGRKARYCTDTILAALALCRHREWQQRVAYLRHLGIDAPSSPAALKKLVQRTLTTQGRKRAV